MATYTLTGTGIQALTADTTSIRVDITTFPEEAGEGTAEPLDYYDVGQLRLGDAVAFFEPIAIVGGPQWIGIPGGTTRVGYSLGDAEVELEEVIGGTSPFGGGVEELAELTDVELSSPADGEVLTYDSALGHWANETPAAGGTSLAPYLHIREEQAAASVFGGTFTSGAWQIRTLNTIVTNEIGIGALSSNTFTLPAGTYRVSASAPAYGVHAHTARLFNVTDSTTTLWGTGEYIENADRGTTRSFILGRFTIAGSKAFRIEHRCLTTRASAGFGNSQNWGQTQIWTSVEIWQE